VQEADDLPVTGSVDKATDAALQAEVKTKGGAEAQAESAATAALQQTLTFAGAWTGPVDGVGTPELTEALKDFQKDLGVKPTGTVDAATVAAFEEAIATAKEGTAGSRRDRELVAGDRRRALRCVPIGAVERPSATLVPAARGADRLQGAARAVRRPDPACAPGRDHRGGPRLPRRLHRGFLPRRSPSAPRAYVSLGFPDPRKPTKDG